ncbi:MAG: ABC transporter substrate-binding protein [Acetobacteraceae bacterium]
MLKRRVLLGSLACAPFVVPSSRAKAADETLHFRLGEDPQTVYNVKSISLTVSSVLGSYLLERLIYFDKTGTPQPWLATAWEFSPDQKVVIFTLRTGIKFSDGTPFNAEAAKAHFDAVMDKNNASPLLSRLGSLQAVEAPDDTTLRFTFDKPYAPFFANIAGATFGFNSPTTVKKYGEHYGRNPVGTGPYVMESWVPGTEIRLVRNPLFQQTRADAINQGKPHAARVVLTVISEESVAQAALESGELTAALVVADAVDELKKNPDLRTVINKVVTNLYFLEYNQTRPPFDNKDAREAISYAINREAVVKAAFDGYASPAYGPLADGIPGYDAAIGDKYGPHFDPSKAKALLAKAGYTPGSDGKLQKDSKPLALLLKSYAGFAVVDRTLSVIQSNLADIGIPTKIETADWGYFYPSLLDHNSWDMDLTRWTSADPGVLSVLFRSPGHRKATLPNPVLDPILDRCDTIMDQSVRKGCIGEAQKAILDAATITPIASDWFVVVTQANVKDFHLDYFNYLFPGDIRIV